MAEPRYLLDANCCIYLIEKLSPALRAKAERCAPGELATSAIAYAEVARGTDWKNEEAASLVNDFFEAVSVLPFDQAAGHAYAALPFVRHRFDRLIAAHALAQGLTLVTANVRDYRDIPALDVEDWTR
ncbi:MAG TPA: type II toxin-antitoxin system VapC family toxin [Sphingomicrobium sp.]